MVGYLIINGIIFFLVGLRALLKPMDAVAAPFGLGADGVDAKNYLRSGAGGVAIAAGLVMLAGAFVPSLSLPGMVVAVTILGGLVFGRLVSVALDGSPGPASWISGTLESVGLVFGLAYLI